MMMHGRGIFDMTDVYVCHVDIHRQSLVMGGDHGDGFLLAVLLLQPGQRHLLRRHVARAAEVAQTMVGYSGRSS